MCSSDLLARCAGVSNDDPFCEPAPSFYPVENLLALDDETDEFRILNPRPRFPFLCCFSHLVRLGACSALWGRENKCQIVVWNPNTLAVSLRQTTVAFSTCARSAPSVHYLRLHPACACAAHKLGAAVYIEAFARDLATLSVLVEDGSPAGVLAAALSRIAGE